MTNRALANCYGAGIPITIGLLWLLCVAPAGTAQQVPSVGAGSCQESLPELYKRVSPAVVLIRATSIDPYDTEHRMQRVTGSGVIIDSSGLILTNSHVVFGRAVIAVTLDDLLRSALGPKAAVPRSGKPDPFACDAQEPFVISFDLQRDEHP